MADDTNPRAPTWLRDEDIATVPATRRLALLGIVGAAAAAFTTGARAQSPQNPQQSPPVETDNDSGPPGAVSGFTDRDRGKQADPPGNGRGDKPAATAVTDFDAGAHADRAGRGRGGRGLGSDNDSGARADPVGEGRRRPTKR
jgi:hypothetical protein